MITSYCGYCNAAHPAGRSCTCPEQQRAHQARQRETEARYANERAGVAAKDKKQYATGRN